MTELEKVRIAGRETCNLCRDPTPVGVNLASQLHEIAFQTHNIRRCRLEVLALVRVGIDFSNGANGDGRVERQSCQVLGKGNGEWVAGAC